MPSFDDISRDYAARIRKAISTDGFTKSAALNESIVKKSFIAAELKAIASELKTWEIGNKPISKEQEERIERGIAEHLNVPDRTVLPRAIKNASNDAYMELLTDISNIIRGAK